jgi:hypothetical protein
MGTTGLSEFKEVLADFQQLGSLALKGVVAAPLADLWFRLGPPPVKSIAVLTSLMEFLAVVWVFQFWYNLAEQKLNIRMKLALCFFVLGLVSSLVLLSRFTVSPGEGRERVVVGWSIRPDVKPLIDSSYTAEQALRDSEYDPDKVWTKESVLVVRTSITIVWIATFVCLAVYLTVFLILQRRRSSVPMVQTASPQ